MVSEIIDKILEWAEVWALLIPIAFAFKGKGSNDLFPLKVYVFVALVINLIATLIPNSMFFYELFNHSNHIFYNLHSIVKVLFFGLLFLNISTGVLERIIRFILIFYTIFVVLNFMIFQSLLTLSGRLLIVEVILLLFFGISWCLETLQKEHTGSKKYPPVFYVVIGLFIYFAVTFILYLLYPSMISQAARGEFDIEFAIRIWDIHNTTFIILCLFIAKAFYERGKL
jgi:hypothetical protein